MLDSGALPEQHVGYLAFVRLVLGATGMLRQQPKDRYAPLEPAKPPRLLPCQASQPAAHVVPEQMTPASYVTDFGAAQ